jgi:hypothetical protein
MWAGAGVCSYRRVHLVRVDALLGLLEAHGVGCEAGRTREHRGGDRKHRRTDPKPMRRPRRLELQTRCIAGRARLRMHAQRAYRARDSKRAYSHTRTL